jgi:hypothetical protein
MADSSPSIKGTGKKKGLRANVTLNFMERVMGIEPTLSAWEAEVLPLNYTRWAMLYQSDLTQTG